MRILMVIPAVGEVYGGTSKIVRELSEALGSLDVEVDLITTNANGDNKLDVPLLQWINEENFRIKYFPYLNLFDYKFSFTLSIWLFKNISDYDLVNTHSVFSYPSLPTYWAAQISNIPYVITPHGMLEPWALAYKAYKKFFYFLCLEKPALQKAKAIHMTGSTEAKNVRDINLKPPLVVIPNGIHRKDFESIPSPEVFYQEFPRTRNKTLIIFLGRIDPKKGLDLLAKAFAKAHQTFPETHLIVAGQDNTGYLSIAQNYFKESGCTNAVTFTGMLTGDLKYAALAASTIYVAPSYSEGFSMSVLEGMASGLPCVITKGCNFPEATDVSEIVDIDAEQIGNALIKLLQNPSKAKEMGDRARQFILENYTWDKVASKMIVMYKRILNQNI